MRTLTAIFALGLAACGAAKTPKYADLPFDPADATHAPDPSKMGPYPVGVVTYEGLIDTTADSIVQPPEQPQVRTDPDGQPRHLVTEVWYPAAESARNKPGKQYNVVDLMTDEEQIQVQQSGITIPLLQTAAVENAEPRLGDAPYPLVIFSHGQYGIRWQTTFYCVQLASHGYIVVSPDHPGNTLQDEFSLKETSSGSLGSSIAVNYLDRQADVMFLISHFTSLDKSDLMYGMSDPTHIGVTGHSFGALTSLREGYWDARVKAIVPLAPTNMEEALLDVPTVGSPGFALTTPTLIEGSGLDMTLPFAMNAAPAYAETSKPSALVKIVNGGHFTFSDLCKFNLVAAASAIQFAGVQNVINDGCGSENTPAAIAEPLVNNYGIGFFNWQLRGSVGSKQFLTQGAGDAISSGAAVFQDQF